MSENEKSSPDEAKNLMLMERLSSLATAQRKEVEDKKEGQKRQGSAPLRGRSFCAVCGTIRLDNDQTGVTCGNQSCIDHVLGRYFELAELEKHEEDAGTLRGALENVGSSFGTETEHATNVADLVEMIEADTVEVNTLKERIAALLGIDSAGADNLISFLQIVEMRINLLSEIISEMEENKSKS